MQLADSSPAQLIPDNSGQIQLAVLSVNSARSSTIRNAKLTSDIINSLPEHSSFLLLAPDRSAFTVVSNPRPKRVQFIKSPQPLSLTIWPQDPFLAVQKKGQTHLLVSKEFKRAEDIAMADSIASHMNWPVAHSNLLFEGGNIVSDDEYIYIGANTIVHNAIEQNISSEEIVRQFQDALGRKVIVVGPVPQVIGHIDMMLTPLGNRHLLLADPKWGARLANKELQEHADRVKQFEQRSMKEFFGHPNIKKLITVKGETIKPPEMVGATKQAIIDSEQAGEILDKLAEQLQLGGFTISRIPFLFQKTKLPEAETEQTTNRPGYPQITYNNVLLESSAGQKKAYIPAYGWEAFDNEAGRVWQELGYQVKSIEGFTTTAMYGGALRCSVKVLKRK